MFVIVDTEFTAWKGSAERNWQLDWEHREIIQIAAIKFEIDGFTFKQLGEFNQFIKPSINPILSDYIKSLTGISQSVIDEYGIPFLDAFHNFQAFTGDCQQILSWGNDLSVLHENLTLNNAKPVDIQFNNHNLRQLLLKRLLIDSNVTSGELAQHFAIDLPGHVHNALHDVKSIYLTIVTLFQRGLLDLDSLINKINT